MDEAGMAKLYYGNGPQQLLSKELKNCPLAANVFMSPAFNILVWIHGSSVRGTWCMGRTGRILETISMALIERTILLVGEFHRIYTLSSFVPV